MLEFSKRTAAQVKGILGQGQVCWRTSVKKSRQCTMCTLFHTNSAGLLKLGHILKIPKKYFNEYIFFPALTTRRKMGRFKFL